MRRLVVAGIWSVLVLAAVVTGASGQSAPPEAPYPSTRLPIIFDGSTIALPSVHTGYPASAVGPRRMHLAGKVNLNGLDTTYYFQYGSRRPVHRTRAVSAKREVKSVRADATIKGLRPGGRYRYRLVAVNGLGRKIGATHTFRIKPTRRH